MNSATRDVKILEPQSRVGRRGEGLLKKKSIGIEKKRYCESCMGTGIIEKKGIEKKRYC
jgi:hypothetical protein